MMWRSLLLVPLLAFGAVYEIAEPDLLEEIESKKEKVLKLLKNLKPSLPEPVYLKPAKRNYSYTVDPTYCLEEPIYAYRDGRYEVLYPAGYCFNPLFYVPTGAPPIIVFDPCSEEQAKKVKGLLKRRPNALLLSAGCLKGNFEGKAVYPLSEALVKRLALKETVSVVVPDYEEGVIKVEVLAP